MAGKDSRNEALALQTSVTEIRIIANKNGHSKLWKYFGFLATGSGDGETFDKKKAVCRLCKVVSPYSGNTTNFATHLEHHHPAEYSAFLEESGRRTSARSAGGSSSSTQVTLQATFTRSQPLPKTSSRHKELVNAVGRFISKDLLPLSAVEGVGFRSLMELTKPRFAVPSRKYFSQTVIPSLYLQERKKVETSLVQAEYCSFTTDLWTAKYQNRSYISVSCHFIDQEWELHSYCLETRELPVDHTAQNIATELSQLLKEWNVRERVCGSTTDNGTLLMQWKYLACLTSLAWVTPFNWQSQSHLILTLSPV